MRVVQDQETHLPPEVVVVDMETIMDHLPDL